MTLDTTLREVVESAFSGMAGMTLGQLLAGVAAGVAAAAGIRLVLWVGKGIAAPEKPAEPEHFGPND